MEINILRIMREKTDSVFFSVVHIYLYAPIFDTYTLKHFMRVTV